MNLIYVFISLSILLGTSHVVSVSNFSFSPNDLDIAVGDDVTWNNISGQHNVDGSAGTYPNNPEFFKNGSVSSSNWTYNYIFTVAGDYTYQCNEHTAMVGTITVSSLSIKEPTIPNTFSIYSIYPNPFNPVTNISYGLPEYSNVQITIFDLSGKAVQSLINEFQSSGYHSLDWNANQHPSGVYFVKIIANEYINTKKLILLK